MPFKKKNIVFLFFLILLPSQSYGISIESLLTNSLKTSVLLYVMGVQVRLLSEALYKNLAETQALGTASKTNQVPIDAIFFQTMVQLQGRSFLESLLQNQYDQTERDKFLMFFDEGLRFPLIMDLFEALTETLQDLGESFVPFAKDVVYALIEGVESHLDFFRGRQEIIGRDLVLEERGEAPLFQFHHTTQPSCGLSDPHCRWPKAGSPDCCTTNFDQLVLQLFKIEVGIMGTALGVSFALASYYVNNAISQALKIEPFCSYLHPSIYLIVGKVTGAYIERALLNQIKSKFLRLMKRLGTHETEEASFFNEQDVREALVIGQKGKELAMRLRASADRLMQNQPPFAQLVTQLLYGARSEQ